MAKCTTHGRVQKTSRPSYSKLTTSLVNFWLKFQALYLKHANIFCWKNVRSFCIAKASLNFSTKNKSVIGYKVIKHLTSWPLNKLVKLTMLCATGPWNPHQVILFIWISVMLSICWCKSNLYFNHQYCKKFGNHQTSVFYSTVTSLTICAVQSIGWLFPRDCHFLNILTQFDPGFAVHFN